jgi:multiple sugar transport system permease protein
MTRAAELEAPLSVARRHRRRRRKEDLAALPYLAHWIVGVAIFVVYPIIAVVYLSFSKYNSFGPPEFAGLANWNYVLFHYPYLLPALGNTLWFVVVMVTSRTVFGLGLGLLMVQVKRGAGVYRTLLYLPYLAPPVAATLAFVFLLNPASGPGSVLLSAVGITPPAWFNDPAWAKPALTVLALWGVGDLMVIFLASLLDLPREQYEAASLDGAGAVRQFVSITLPTIKPIILFSVVTGVIAIMQYYTQPMVAAGVASGQSLGPGSSVTPGYPDGSTLTLPQLVYFLGFQNFDVGSASVVAVLLVVVSFLFTLVLLKGGSGLMAEDD